MSIYIPDDMKARMDKAGERANWSAIAQRAFDVELNHLETIKEISSMSDVVERLKASKARYAEVALSNGRKSGTDWARRYAEFQELRRVAEVDEAEIEELAGTEAACHLFEKATGAQLSSEAFGREDLAEFFLVDETAFDAITPEFVAGFVVGARDVWEEVADQI